VEGRGERGGGGEGRAFEKQNLAFLTNLFFCVFACVREREVCACVCLCVCVCVCAC